MATYRASIQVSDTDTTPMILEIEAESDALALDRAIKCTVDPSHVIALKRLDWTDVLCGLTVKSLAHLDDYRAVLVGGETERRTIRFQATSPAAAYKYAFEACAGDENETVVQLSQLNDSGWSVIRFSDM